jgi:hypothetical protein
LAQITAEHNEPVDRLYHRALIDQLLAAGGSRIDHLAIMLVLLDDVRHAAINRTAPGSGAPDRHGEDGECKPKAAHSSNVLRCARARTNARRRRFATKSGPPLPGCGEPECRGCSTSAGGLLVGQASTGSGRDALVWRRQTAEAATICLEIVCRSHAHIPSGTDRLDAARP